MRDLMAGFAERDEVLGIVFVWSEWVFVMDLLGWVVAAGCCALAAVDLGDVFFCFNG